MSRVGGVAAGLATFNSCNKAGSIPHFTQHLRSNPGDYTALMWRGRAYSIIGDRPNAIRDFAAAAANSSGPRKCVAEYFEASSRQDGDKSMKILGEALRKYPNSHEVVGEAGCLLNMCKDYSAALPLLEKSISLMEAAGPFKDPTYCWIKHDIGSIYLEQKKVDAAERAFSAALRFSETHTVSHIGYARVKLAKGDEHSARRHYDRARVLNPTLVHWTTFESFKEAVQPATWLDIMTKLLPRTMANLLVGSPTSTGATGVTSAPVTQVSVMPPPTTNPSNRQSSRSYSAAGTSSLRHGSSTNRPSSAVTRTASAGTRSASSADALASTNRPYSSLSTVPSANQSTYEYHKPATGGRTSTRSSFEASVSVMPPPTTNPSNRQSSRSYSAAGTSSSRHGSSTNTSRPSSAVTRTSSTGTRSSTAAGALNSSVRPSSAATSTDKGLNWRKTKDGWVHDEVEASRQSKRTRGSHRTGTSNYSSGATGNRGKGNGNGGDSGGSGSDDEDESSNEKWKRMRKESREILKHGGKEYVLSRDEKYYYSRDKAGHGTAYLKLYSNKKNRLDFLGSLDRNMKFMKDKHESREGTTIRKSEMDVVRRR